VSTQSPASQTRHFHDSAELSRVRRRCPWARELRPDLRIGCLSAARPHETRKPRQRSIASSFWESSWPQAWRASPTFSRPQTRRSFTHFCGASNARCGAANRS